MDPAGLGQEYLLFGLACDRLMPGTVDCYVGPPELLRRATAQPAPTPAALAARARWLRAEVHRCDLPGPRADFLDRQLAALQCAVRRAAGAQPTYRAEVLAYFDTDIAPGEPDAYRAAHADLAAVLPGAGDLGSRLAAYRERDRMPPGLLGPALQRVAEALRGPARTTLGLPADEAVFFDLVADRPWSAFHSYLGRHRSRVSVNADIDLGVTQLARLVAHETYPGHHAEHVRAEQARLAGAEPAENALFLLNTPQCLISEGQADLGLEVLAGPEYRSWLPEVLDGLVAEDLAELVDVAQRVERALEVLLPVRQDAALLLHDRARSEAEVLGYLRRWLLVDERRAGQMLRFITHPRWRAYTTTYVEGRRLVRSWLAAGRTDESVTERYQRLRREPRSPTLMRAQLTH